MNLPAFRPSRHPRLIISRWYAGARTCKGFFLVKKPGLFTFVLDRNLPGTGNDPVPGGFYWSFFLNQFCAELSDFVFKIHIVVIGADRKATFFQLKPNQSADDTVEHGKDRHPQYHTRKSKHTAKE